MKDLPRAHLRSFDLAISSRFEDVDVEIEPPDFDDPGQLVKSRDLIKTVVSALSLAARLPEITITLLETETRNWYVDQISFTVKVPQCSSPSVKRFLKESDIEIVLRTFRFLRNVQDATITLPSPATSEAWVTKFAMWVKTSIMLSGAFGTRTNNISGDDENIRSEERSITIMLDLDLDNLEGRTAA